MNVSIIGTGNMAKGIATRFVSGGHTVTVHAHHEDKGEAFAAELADVKVVPVGGELDEVVILATPYTAVEEVASEYSDLAGKIVVDITNPVDFNTFQLIPEAGKSGAEEVAKILGDSIVVKAFNTTLAGPLVAGEVEGKELDVFVAGDDADAKAKVSELIKTSGMRPVDVGALANSRHLEGFGLIQMAVQDQIGTGWMSALKFLG